MSQDLPAGITNANWIIDGKLLAMAFPLEDELIALKNAGFGLVINLTEKPSATKLAGQVGIKGAFLPILNMTAPMRDQIEEFVAIVSYYLSENLPVAVHCLFGVGRTGTMIACYLVSIGFTPEDAITHVRQQRPGSVETNGQVRAIYQYYDYLQKQNHQTAIGNNN